MIGVIDVGGGNRGAFGAGFFDYCLDEQIVFDYCIGISAGSANVSSYIAKQRGRNYRFYTKHNLSREAISAHNLLKKHSVVDFHYIYNVVSNEDGLDPFDYDTFQKSKQKMVVVVTDALTGKPIYYSNDSIQRNQYGLLAASCNIPVINQPYIFNGSACYDGGLVDPIPIEHAFADGCDKVVVILTRPKDYYRTNERDKKVARLMKKYPAIKEAMVERAEIYNAQLDLIKQYEREGKVLIMAPKELAHIDTLGKDTTVINALYEEGYEQAKQIVSFIEG